MSVAPARVAIVGRDAALWLTAAVLQRALAPAGVTVTAIELPTRLGPGSAYASLPPIEALHDRLGLDELALLRATQGCFSLGTNVAAPGAPPFFLAHGSIGAPIDGAGFFPYWVKARRFGLGAALEDFCLTTMAARQGRMLVPDDEIAAFGRADYGYHLPALAYAAVLKGAAKRLGATLHQSRSVGLERGEVGTIAAVLLDDGTRIAADLFVDASGADAALIGGSREDWRIAADRVLTARGAPFASVPAYAELRIGETGWAALHASQAATHIVHAYSSQNDGAALAAAQALAGLSLADAIIAPVAPGRRDAWQGNCVAIGSAACEFDPLFDLELHTVQLGIVHLLSLFPASIAFAAERDEYNRITRSAFERMRDFQSVFYALNRFPGAFWQAARDAAAPDAVAHKIAAFRARGEIAPMEDEVSRPTCGRPCSSGSV